MSSCLFCMSNGPFTTVEHIIPESLGNDDLTLVGEVCDSCQSYFGKEVEQYALSKTPLAFWRVYFGVKTKKGKEPSVDLSQPTEQKGTIACRHYAHDNIGFTSHPDGSISVEVYDDSIIQQILHGNKRQFITVCTPKVLHMLGRFLCKVGLELLCLDNPSRARSVKYDESRMFSRFGSGYSLWPIFHYSYGNIDELKQYRYSGNEIIIESTVYSFSLVDFMDKYTLFGLSVGTDNWIVCLNDPLPIPDIREAVPVDDLNLLWYRDS